MSFVLRDLAEKATRIHKAIQLAGAFSDVSINPTSVQIPNYTRYPQNVLAEFVESSRRTFRKVAQGVVVTASETDSDRLIPWLSDRFDEWGRRGFGVLCIARVAQFEAMFGPLFMREILDCPPYAELLLQGLNGGVAVRHPEYMLSRDIECLYSMYLDAEALVGKTDWKDPPKWARPASENCYSLGRSTIIACFNLLESFTSGLVERHIATHSLGSELSMRVRDSSGSLKKRLTRIVFTMSDNRFNLNLDRVPHERLFGELKRRRDSFVHCSPGLVPTERGEFKEQMLHDIRMPIVQETVRMTLDLIRAVWLGLAFGEEPSWIPRLAQPGGGRRINLTVAPPVLRDPFDQ